MSLRALVSSFNSLLLEGEFDILLSSSSTSSSSSIFPIKISYFLSLAGSDTVVAIRMAMIMPGIALSYKVEIGLQFLFASKNLIIDRIYLITVGHLIL